MILLAALAVLSAPVVDLSGLQLSLTTTQPTLLAGEPTRVDVTWTASSPVMIAKDFLQIVLAAPGSAPVQWSEATNGIGCGIPGSHTMRPGESFVTSHVIAARGRMKFSAYAASSDLQFAFPTTGVYRVQARYGTVASNWLTIDVVPPVGEEATVYEFIRANPWLVTPFVSLRQPVNLEVMLRLHPESRYLARTRLLLWEEKARRAYEDAPEQPGVVPFTGNVPAVLDEIATTPIPGPVDEDRLVLLARSAEMTAHRETALAAWRELLRKYPAGPGAAEARRRPAVLTGR